MELHHRTENNIYIITIEGDLASKNMSEIEKFISPLVEDQSRRGIAIDFAQIAFIDSSGVGLILSMFKNLQARGANLVLYNLSEESLEIFEMTRLNDILSIYATEEEALASYIPE